MEECYVCLSPGGERACRCAAHVHILCLAPLILANGFRCKSCGGEFNKEATLAIARHLVATHGISPQRRYLLCWALVRAGRAEEALGELNTLVGEATLFSNGRRSNAQVMRGRALLQLRRREEAIRAFRSARALLEQSRARPIPQEEIETYGNTFVGLALAYMGRARADAYLRDARAIAPLASLSTVAKIMRASAAQAHLRGDDERAHDLLSSLHKVNLRHETDSVGRAETAAGVQVARGRCMGRTVNRDILRRCLRIMRRDGKPELVVAAALSLASTLRPRARLRVKSRPETVTHRKRCKARK